ncbi:succinyl-diaminopimelate desuccinylase [Dichotomicrobium thermohalophilum]|uniref:Succinyl-diaminopimelate desuccinylase n=1 Tax=Dichotomicrobium thermohalophilum TaxID=933063 RepID=A0A397QCG2_9HYPH|nr:succinyl-diaminopimelate desuccinylase [Dichotomicrobium thermohalophilum]RIA55941.1 succinyldiaminopimelate desuccinylase [Dichotomicrobium thermohalophilum]
MSAADPLALAADLIRCPSVTPDAATALDVVQGALEPAGFACHRLVFSAPGTPDVDNLYARIGAGRPHLCFAGHVDVVPPGDEAAWRHPPFSGVIADGELWGRGAVDMKGGVACMMAAALDFLAARGTPAGAISFLITGDEEGPAVNGTRKVLDWMAEQGERPDHCLLGEPTNPKALGETIKIGRRGSLSGRLVITGTQGHVAYPDQANNPIRGLARVLNWLTELRLDDGTTHFAPSNLEVTSIDAGNAAHNVIPAQVTAKFNIRFNDAHTPESLKELIAGRIGEALAGTGLAHDLQFRLSGDSFLTEPGPWVEALSAAIAEVTGRTPHYDTGGGTSDARFIKDTCPVVEFGLTYGLIHAVDERVPVDDLHQLTAIYRRFLERYFA